VPYADGSQWDGFQGNELGLATIIESSGTESGTANYVFSAQPAPCNTYGFTLWYLDTRLRPQLITDS